MARFDISYRSFGDEALLIVWPSRIDEQILMEMLAWQKMIEDQQHLPIMEMQNTYHSLIIFFDKAKISLHNLIDEIKRLGNSATATQHGGGKIWKLPVCYDVRFGIDLGEMASRKNTTIPEIIQLHASVTYRVYFTGFLPGFLYLGGLSNELIMPRKETPRQKISRGAVAIGGSQTGIYPRESPGGWNIIGNCPVPLFDAGTTPPCKISAGDQIQFIPISWEEYHAIASGHPSTEYDD